MQLRDFETGDWAQVWPIVREVVRAADTFTYDPEMTAEQAYDTWVQPPPLTVTPPPG